MVILFKNNKEDNTNTYKYYIFQTGVYKNINNANNNINSGIIIKEEKFYHVYNAIVKNKDLIYLYKNYFNKLKIVYYIKEIYLSDDYFNKYISDYEKKLSSVDESDIKSILLLYEESINDINKWNWKTKRKTI